MSKFARKAVVLYFTEGSNLTEAQADEMNRIPGARHRNASLVDSEQPREACTAVAGDRGVIPEIYDGMPIAKPLAADDVDDTDVDVDDQEYASMTAPQLKKLLTDAGVEVPNGAKKAQLVALCEEHLTEEEED